MSRYRSFPTNLFFVPKFEALSSDTLRLIYIGIILDADDYGRGIASVSILGRKLAQPPDIVERALSELEQQGFVECYEVEEEHYYYVCNWFKLQKLSKPTNSGYPPSPSQVASSEDPRKIQVFPKIPREILGNFRKTR